MTSLVGNGSIGDAIEEGAYCAVLEKGEKMTNEEKLIEAAEEGDLQEVKQLTQHGADIHAENDYALQLAARNGHLEVVKYLIQSGAEIHAGNDAALRWAARNGHLEVIKYLIRSGADIHAGNDAAFRWASENGHLEVVEYLKSVGNQPVKKHTEEDPHAGMIKNPITGEYRWF